GIELNKVLNSGSRISQALAEHFNTTTGGLMQLAQQGRITSDVIYRVLTSRMTQLREEAESMPATIEDGFTALSRSLLVLVGQFDEVRGVSGSVADILITVARNMEDVAYWAGWVAQAWVSM